MQRMILFVVAAVLAGLFIAPEVHATAVTVLGDDVSVWDSTVPENIPLGIFPIGGTGQINGEFVTSTYVGATFGNVSAIQIGLRAQKRFEGPTLTRIGNTYFTDTGTTNGPSGAFATGALWNYDIHLDFGTEYLETQALQKGLLNPGETLDPLNMRDFMVVFELDIDPSVATNFVSTDLNQFATDLGLPATSPILLSQTSQNMLFNVFGGGPSVFDPNAPGIYDFRLSVVDLSNPSNPHTVVQVEIQVNVVPLPAAMWMGFSLLGGAGVVRGIRRYVATPTH